MTLINQTECNSATFHESMRNVSSCPYGSSQDLQFGQCFWSTTHMRKNWVYYAPLVPSLLNVSKVYQPKLSIFTSCFWVLPSVSFYISLKLFFNYKSFKISDYIFLFLGLLWYALMCFFQLIPLTLLLGRLFYFFCQHVIVNNTGAKNFCKQSSPFHSGRWLEGCQRTVQWIHFERYWTAPEKWWVVGAGFDPSDYFPGCQNFFRRANQEIFGFSIFMIWIFATLWIKSMGTAAAADSIDILSFL